ncbi:MAG: serine hydrolase domain-containing protein [Gammaproteobacteria bacterium]
MKRAAWILGLLGLIVAAAAAVRVSHDPLFWKRYAFSLMHSQATLPDSFYEPSEIIAGVDGPEPPRVQPELEHLDAGALHAAADYAGARHTSALMVGRHGHIVFEQYWDGGGSDAVSNTDAFNATVAALMVGIAMGDHKIGLVAEPVANYVEEFRGDERQTITIADLLHGASGLEPHAASNSPWSAALRERFSTDIMASCLSHTLESRPGERWLPQICDAQLLARVVERATHERYASYISERLWKPLGAADAQLWRDSGQGNARADCCLRARRGDWMRIAELLVNDGRFEGEQVIPPGWVRQMLAPSKDNANFGSQVWLGLPFTAGQPGSASESYAADDTYLLKSAGKTRLWFVPSLGLSILRTGTNSESDTDWDDARVPNLIIRGASDFVPKAATGAADDLSKLVPNH